MKELVDGTIRVQIDIDPIHRADFFALFSRIDMPVALAPLVANFEQIKPCAPEPVLVQESTLKSNNNKVLNDGPPKGGELAKWAGILSNDPVFWEWASKDVSDCFVCDPVTNEAEAANYIRGACYIESRAELDHNPEAAKIFRNMMGAFDDWKNMGKTT